MNSWLGLFGPADQIATGGVNENITAIEREVVLIDVTINWKLNVEKDGAAR